MVSPCSRMRSALTVTSLSSVVPGSSRTVSGNETLSRGMVFLAKLIIDTSNRQPVTDGSDMAKPPSPFDVAYFFILPSAPFTMTDAPVNGSLLSLSTTVPDTLTCATALTATIRKSIYARRRFISRGDSWFPLCRSGQSLACCLRVWLWVLRRRQRSFLPQNWNACISTSC